MGTECDGTVTVGGQKVPVQADFGSDHVTFHGGRRGQVRYNAIEVVSTGKGLLRIRVDGALMEFRLGPKTERIASKIRKPPSRIEKIGVRQGALAAAVDIGDAAFLQELAGVADLLQGQPTRPVDLLFVGVSTREGLGALADLKAHLHPEGALWVVFPRSKREIPEADVLAAGRESGLKDVKVVRFSERDTAVKFVLPRAERIVE